VLPRLALALLARGSLSGERQDLALAELNTAQQLR
jgi:hypothetical protein